MDTRNITILIGTTNPGKRAKLRWLLEHIGLERRPITDDLLRIKVTEDQLTHRGNAEKKALTYSRFTDDLVITSDGGMVVPALENHWDSLNTRKFVGPDETDEQRVSSLLRMMEPFDWEDRNIAWKEAVAIAYKGSLLGLWEAKGRHGILLKQDRPSSNNSGLWLDYLWYFPSFQLVYEELTEYQRFLVQDPWSQIRPLIKRFFMSHTDELEGKLNPHHRKRQ